MLENSSKHIHITQFRRNLPSKFTNGKAIPMVTWLENVSLSLGWTKSMKDLPSHISFGKPNTAVRLGVV